MKQMSDATISAVYQKMIVRNPRVTADSIVKGFKGTPFRMRRQDALRLIKELKAIHKTEVPSFKTRNKNSSMTESSQRRVSTAIDKTARKEALFKTQQKSTSRVRKAKTKGKEVETLKDMRGRTYKNVDASQDYVEFYG